MLIFILKFLLLFYVLFYYTLKIFFLLYRGAYLYRRERKKRSHKFSERSIESGTEAKRRARSSGSRATSATTGSSEDGSSGQHEDYDTEVCSSLFIILTELKYL